MNRWFVSSLALLSSSVLGCTDLPGEPELEGDTEADITPDTAALEGTWRQRGYARVVSIHGRELTTYDVTSVSCVPSESTTLEDFMGRHDRVEVGSDSFSWYEVGQFTRYEFDRLEALPAPCTAPVDSRPIATFEALWHLFDENYAFFDERAVDWNASYDTHRARIHDDLETSALMSIFSDLLVPLDDGHVYVFDGVSEGFLSGSFGALWERWAASYEGEPVDNPAAPRGVFIEQMQAYVLDDVLGGEGRSGLFDALHWGWLDTEIAYLDVHTMAPDGPEDLDGDEILVEVDRAMARVLGDLEGAQALIVDARFNEGGLDSIGYAIAGHFVDAPVLVSRKYARHEQGTTTPQDVFVVPRGASRFDGPIVLLQGPNTVSAAETFALALRALPQVQSVGEATYGSLSDVLLRILPNGWLVALSNETYESHDGQIYEARGVPVDLEIAYDDTLDLRSNLNRVLDVGVQQARMLIQ